MILSETVSRPIGPFSKRLDREMKAAAHHQQLTRAPAARNPVSEHWKKG
jgi:hypothetical protein